MATMSFGRRSAGAGGGGAVVRFVAHAPDHDWPWALVSSCLATMVSGAGDAHADFLLEEGDGAVAVIPRGTALIVGGGYVIRCVLVVGGVYVGGQTVRGSTRGWGAPLSPGETVRLRYVSATRMVSVVWRGVEHDISELPATVDVAHTRFGVAVSRGNAMRLVSASCFRYNLPYVRWLVRARVMCQAGRASVVDSVAPDDVVSWICVRAPLWVVARVCALL
jgi:hypothetical protein